MNEIENEEKNETTIRKIIHKWIPLPHLGAYVTTTIVIFLYLTIVGCGYVFLFLFVGEAAMFPGGYGFAFFFLMLIGYSAGLVLHICGLPHVPGYLLGGVF